MSGNQHELFMMALTAVLSIIVGFLGGRIWEAFRAYDEEGQLSRDEIKLITADRLRREREEPTPKKPVVAVYHRPVNSQKAKSKRRASGG